MLADIVNANLCAKQIFSKTLRSVLEVSNKADNKL